MPDTLLSRVDPKALPEDLRALWAASKSLIGEGDRLEVFGNHPALYRWYQQRFYGDIFIGAGGDMLVEARWKELIRLKLSLSNGCFVCNAHNIPAGLKAGYSQQQIDAMHAPTPELFSPQELAVLALGKAFAIANPDGALTPELHAQLGSFFTDAQILELGLVAAILSGWTKLMFAFDLVTREATCPIARPGATPI